jgi:hypothetical protein
LSIKFCLPYIAAVSAGPARKRIKDVFYATRVSIGRDFTLRRFATKVLGGSVDPVMLGYIEKGKRIPGEALHPQHQGWRSRAALGCKRRYALKVRLVLLSAICRRSLTSAQRPCQTFRHSHQSSESSQPGLRLTHRLAISILLLDDKDDIV